MSLPGRFNFEIYVDPKRVMDRIEQFVAEGRGDAMNWLHGRGHDIADLTQRKGKRKHGPLWSRPAVRRERTLVRVGFFRVRRQTRKVLYKHLDQAKRFVMSRAHRFPF